MPITDDNPFVRRGALALVNLQATPMSPTGGSAVDHYTDPQLADGHVTASHTRDLFPAWPADYVAKIKRVGGGALKNLLRLRCRSYTTGDAGWAVQMHSASEAGGDFLLAPSIRSAVNQTALWSQGDDKVYAACTTKYNVYRGTDPLTGQPLYDIITYVWALDPTTCTMELVSTSSVTGANAEDTYANAWLGNGTTFGGVDYAALGITGYAQFSVSVDYADYIENYMEGFSLVDNYSTDLQVYRSGREPSQDPHGLAASYVTIVPDGNNGSDRVVAAKVNPSTSLARNGLFTYKLADGEDPLVYVQKDLVKARWLFTPTGCSPCPFAGKEVEVKVRFKQATVTRTIDTGSSTHSIGLSLGGWSSHSEQTFTLTLPDSLSEQTLDSEFDFPSVAGSVVAIDDIEIVSVS